MICSFTTEQWLYTEPSITLSHTEANTSLLVNLVSTRVYDKLVKTYCSYNKQQHSHSCQLANHSHFVPYLSKMCFLFRTEYSDLQYYMMTYQRENIITPHSQARNLLSNKKRILEKPPKDSFFSKQQKGSKKQKQ